MEYTLKQLAEHVGGKVVGDPETRISGVNSLEDAGEGDITFLSNKKYEKMLASTRASAVVMSREYARAGRTGIVSDDPYLAFAKIVAYVAGERPRPEPGIHPTAVIAKSVRLGREVSVGPYAVIDEDVSIGNRVAIYSGVYIGVKTRVGDETVVYPNAVIYDETVIGMRVIIHAGVTIGSDGFGFAPDGERYFKIPQVGNTIIEDDVSIGANTVINRGSLKHTIVRKGCKIDSNCVISHNVDVGENTLMISQVGISGSVKIGKHCVFAGQAGLVGHIEIGDNVTVAAQTGVTHDLPGNAAYFGTPVAPIVQARKMYAALARLPELRDRIRNLEKRIEMLEKQLGKPKDPTGK